MSGRIELSDEWGLDFQSSGVLGATYLVHYNCKGQQLDGNPDKEWWTSYLLNNKCCGGCGKTVPDNILIVYRLMVEL